MIQKMDEVGTEEWRSPCINISNTYHMKKLVISILVLFALLSMQTQAQDTIMVIADPHVLPQTEIAKETNFANYMAKQRQMVDLSEPIWKALMDTALKYKPSLVLIPGDLTRDGEPAAHDTVSAALERLQQAGIRTLVIPGNHDLPATVAWEELYPGTFENAVKDPNSFSYAVEPLPGVTVIGIDGSNGNAGTGVLKPGTLQFVLAQADSAVAKGHMIIAMSHWQILEHFDQKTKRNSFYKLKDKRVGGFNSILATSCIPAAILYYNEFMKQMESLPEDKKPQACLQCRSCEQDCAHLQLRPE